MNVGGTATPGTREATVTVAIEVPEVTVKVAELLVALPTELETMTWKTAPLSEVVVPGVV
jgi:hypothetical protein